MTKIYFGDLLVQTNAHIKPRGKRKSLTPQEMEHRKVYGIVWSGEGITGIKHPKHTISMICKKLKIKNTKAVKIKKILNCKQVGTANRS